MSLDIARASATKIVALCEELKSATAKRPVVDIVSLEWLVTREGEDGLKASAILKRYDALVAEVAKLGISEENATAAQVWYGSRGGKLRNAISALAASLKALSALDNEIAGDASVSAALALVAANGSTVSATVTPAPSTTDSLDARVKAWARAKGWPVGDRGAASKAYKDAYAAEGLS